MRLHLKKRDAVAVALALLAAATTATAQDTKASPCQAPEHRQFDFWLGTWTVTDRDGAVQGTNTISRILDGCVLYESWSGAGGSRGHSFNIYSATRKAWHQTWVDASGTLLLLDGGLVDGRMVLEGDTPARDGSGTLHHRITWTPVNEAEVTQHWQVTRDGGETWRELFFGVYRK